MRIWGAPSTQMGRVLYASQSNSYGASPSPRDFRAFASLQHKHACAVLEDNCIHFRKVFVYQLGRHFLRACSCVQQGCLLGSFQNRCNYPPQLHAAGRPLRFKQVPDQQLHPMWGKYTLQPEPVCPAHRAARADREPQPPQTLHNSCGAHGYHETSCIPANPA